MALLAPVVRAVLQGQCEERISGQPLPMVVHGEHHFLGIEFRPDQHRWPAVFQGVINQIVETALQSCLVEVHNPIGHGDLHRSWLIAGSHPPAKVVKKEVLRGVVSIDGIAQD